MARPRTQRERWKKEELDAVCRDHLERVPIKVTARRIGREPNAVNKMRNYLGLRWGKKGDGGSVSVSIWISGRAMEILEARAAALCLKRSRLASQIVEEHLSRVDSAT